ncbi:MULTISPECIES: pyruvate ferredoxin oxidoreductase [unclassified Methanoregula]|uniref:pyruvate ferredoxin oxidoreductase n=1 Tax=unclassified Methanoregula TaxID=2649730 RepID=UPI0009C94CCC|nr:MULTISPECIES: pyruvate ferredoxin oxidoreductase [unclassified Methanoregula]OPX61968.1 MAG: Pyruvate synthase subunit PorA [Methanoregula sp. PtaB.Bin085]OPY34357.1 MAG: Pyruvate synthase subunit PorA [Methanoregula sp. PtaU1.Bin006]
MMEITEGSHAVAEAVRLCRPQVVSAYPITPQTHIVEALADFVANGMLDAEYITVENELSALSACVGASAAGSRAYSATTSQGLMLMAEVVFNASGMRLPIVMSIANRAMGAPLSIWNDMQDSISLRDAGWLHFYAEDNQEATDLHFLAYKVAEDPAVQLPAFVCFDGFILSHTYEPVDMLTQADVDKYLPKFNPSEKLDASDPMSFGMYATPEYYLEFRYEMDQALKRAKGVIAKAGKEFGSLFGRDYSALIETYRLEDAETAIVAMGSVCGTVKDAIDEMRAEGMKVGLLRIRVFRPFPAEEIVKGLSHVKRIAVLDKNVSLGSRGGATAIEVRDAMYGSTIPVKGYILGLGGRDIRKKDIKEIVTLCERGIGDQFYGLRRELI